MEIPKDLPYLIAIGVLGALVVGETTTLLILFCKGSKKSCCKDLRDKSSQTEEFYQQKSFDIHPVKNLSEIGRNFRSPSLDSQKLIIKSQSSSTFPRTGSFFSHAKPPKSEKLPRKIIYTEEDVKKLSPPPSFSFHHSKTRSEPINVKDIFKQQLERIESKDESS